MDSIFLPNKQIDFFGGRMQTLLEILFTLIAFISIIPAIHMFRNRKDRKYACLKVLIYATFVWTLFMVLERVSSNTVLTYYVSMLGYPLKMIFASLMLCTIFQYVEKKFPKWLLFVLGGLVFTDLIFALTNSWTQAFLKLSVEELTTFNDLYTALKGPLFIYHLLISYAIALTAIILLFVFLAKKQSIRQYKEVTKMMVISICIVLLFNSLQLFLIEVNVDLTYFSLVVVAYSLYDVIYRKDMIFNLRTSGRSEILANMRELYILTDHQKRVIEVSPLLLDKYNLDEKDIIGQPFSDIIEQLKSKLSLYETIHIDQDEGVEKDHYHLREKEFHLKGIRETGYMILLYDETQVYNLLRELNRLSNFDAMTGLNNRNYIEKKLETISDTQTIGVFSIDLNGLKVNNDYLGHERGDRMLKKVAYILKESFKDVKEKDIARIGGDEFLVITYQINEVKLEEYFAKLLDNAHHDNVLEEVSISVGQSSDSTGVKSIYTLIKEADDRMYEMKANTSKDYQKRLIDYIHKQDTFIR